MPKINIKNPMYRLLSEIEVDTKKTITDIVKILDMSRQNYYRLKNSKSKQIQLLVEIKEKFDLDWTEIGKLLEKDYGKKK